MIVAFVFSGRSQQPPPPFWVFLLAIAGIWILVAFVISRVGGWKTLAEHYRAEQPFFGTFFRFQSAQLRGGTNYNGCLKFGVDANGLCMAVMAPFRIFHPPLFIPWNEISARPIQLWRFWNFVELRFHRTPDIPVKIRINLADKLALASNGRFAHRVVEAAIN